MSARPHIENTLYRYSWAMDMDQMDMMGAVFTEDARVDFPEGSGLKVGRAAIVEELTRRREAYKERGVRPWHVITNVFILEEDEREATVRSFFTASRSEPDGTVQVSSMGLYEDRFVDDGDAWRVAERRVVGAHTLPVT